MHPFPGEEKHEWMTDTTSLSYVSSGFPYIAEPQLKQKTETERNLIVDALTVFGCNPFNHNKKIGETGALKMGAECAQTFTKKAGDALINYFGASTLLYASSSLSEETLTKRLIKDKSQNKQYFRVALLDIKKQKIMWGNSGTEISQRGPLYKLIRGKRQLSCKKSSADASYARLFKPLLCN